MHDLMLSIKLMAGSSKCMFINFDASVSYFVSVPAPTEILQN